MERFRFGLSGLCGPRTEAKLYGNEGASLDAYARTFGAYEIGATRYDHWTRDNAESLVANMPSNVALIPRFSRTIVQNGSLEGQKAELNRWLDSVEPLLQASNRGPIYLPWTVPWSSKAERELQDVLEALWPSLPSSQRIAVEFRHGSWFQPSSVQLLEEYGAGLVWSTLAGMVPYRATADFIYVRLTGHHSRRVADEVHALSARIEARPSDERTVYCISSRYHDPYGIKAIERFAGRVGRGIRLQPTAPQIDDPGQPSLMAFAAG